MELQQVIDGSGSTDEYVLLDGLGREISRSKFNDQSPAWDKTDTCYDARGLNAFVSYPYQSSAYNSGQLCSGAGDTYSYDGIRRVNSLQHSDGSSISTYYVGAATSVTDEGNGDMNTQKISQVDGLGRLISLCEVTSAIPAVGPSPGPCNQKIGATGFLTSYSYDGLGNLLNVSQSGLGDRVFTYDSFSHLTSAGNPESGTTSYHYNNDGVLTSQVRPAPNQGTGTVTTTYTPDPLHRVTAISYSDGTTPAVAYGYDESSGPGGALANSVGRRTSGKVSTSGGQVLSGAAYTYDKMGRVTTNWQCTVQGCPSGTYYSLNYGWDNIGDMTSAGDSGSGVSFTYSYNKAERLVSVTSSLHDQNHPGTMLSGSTYNAYGSVTADVLGNGVQDSFAYLPRGWLQNIVVGVSDPGQGTQSQGSLTFTGSEQTYQTSTSGTATVAIEGSEQSENWPDGCLQHCQIVYDTGTVTITVNGTPYTANYNRNSTANSLATALTAALNAGTLVNAQLQSDGFTIKMTALITGSGSNYPFTTSYTYSTQYFEGPSFDAAPPSGSLQGGATQTIYDTGTVTVTVQSNPQTIKTVSYGQGSSPSSVVSALSTAFNGDPASSVTASSNGATLTLTSKAKGSVSNYVVNTSSATTNQGGYFPPLLSGETFTVSVQVV